MPTGALLLVLGVVYVLGMVTLAAVDAAACAADNRNPDLPPVVIAMWPAALLALVAVGVVVATFMLPVWAGRWIARRLAAREEARDAE